MLKAKTKCCVPDRSRADGNNRHISLSEAPDGRREQEKPLQLMEKTDEMRENDRIREWGQEGIKKCWRNTDVWRNREVKSSWGRGRLVTVSFLSTVEWGDVIRQGQACLFLWFEAKGKPENNNSTPFQLMLETAFTADPKYDIKRYFLVNTKSFITLTLTS